MLELSEYFQMLWVILESYATAVQLCDSPG